MAPWTLARFQNTPKTKAGKRVEHAKLKADTTIDKIPAGFKEAA